MAYFSKLNSSNVVIDVQKVNNDVITVNGVEQEQVGIDFLKNLFNEPDAVWKKTSYNTQANQYYIIDGISGEMTLAPDQSKAFRKNYGAISFTYDEVNDAFIPPKPYNSWTLNTTSYTWQAPVAMPSFDETTQTVDWDEANQQWVIIDGINNNR